jgi:hypothetical protein
MRSPQLQKRASIAPNTAVALLTLLPDGMAFAIGALSHAARARHDTRIRPSSDPEIAFGNAPTGGEATQFR